MDKYSKNLIIASFIIEESIYFFDWLNHNTTLIILSKPQNDGLENLFIDHCTKLQCTVMYTNEYYSKDDVISQRTKNIINGVLNSYPIDNIITHPQENIFKLNKSVYDFVTEKKLYNHFVYTINKNIRKLNSLQILFLQSYADIYVHTYSIPNSSIINEKFIKTAQTISQDLVKI